MNKEKIILSIISWLTVIISIAMIMNFSSESGEESNSTSSEVVDSIIEVLPNGDNITPVQKNNLKFSVRKLAHLGIYMLLGFCLINAVCITFSVRKLFAYLVSFPLPFLYAIFDEFIIQNKTFGRAPQWLDVGIDYLGAICGMLLYILFTLSYSFLLKKIAKKRKSN